MPRKLYTFTGDERYLNEEMFNSEAETLHTLHNWIPLSSGKPLIQQTLTIWNKAINTTSRRARVRAFQ